MRGDSPENIGEVEVKIDWVVNDALSNDVEPEKIKEILEHYKEEVCQQV